MELVGLLARRAFFAVLLMVSGDPAPANFVGYWYGENYQPSVRKFYQELDHHLGDGTFVNEFRQYENCKLIFLQREAGTWSVANGVAHQITRSINDLPVNPDTDPSLIDDYQILVLDDHDYQSRHVSDGTIYKVWRVNDKFRFPDCSYSS